MELEEMKAVWKNLSDQIEQQKKVSSKIILEMTNERSKSRLNNIILTESVGILVTVIGLGYLFVNFHKLDNMFTLIGGIGISLVFGLSLVMGFIIIKKGRSIDIAKNSVMDTLRNFSDLRKILHLYKKISIPIYVVIPFFLIPVISKILYNKDVLVDSSEFWTGIIAAAVLMPIAWYLIYFFYYKNIKKVKELFNDLEE